ncbi:MAG: Ca-activated chloride channel [Actinomycetota bacterium]
MTFERPLLLLTLLAVPLAVALYVLSERRRMRYAIRFTNLDVLASVAGSRYRRRFVPLALFLLALAALCIGMARPRHTTLVPRDRATVILVIDVSRSMEAKDVKPNRIGAAAAAIRTFLGRVPDRLQVGLIAFAGDPAVAAPPTTNHDLVRKSLETIEWFPSFGGTAIGDALAAAVKLGQQAVGGQNGNLASATAATPETETQGLVSILFLSDGAQTRGDLEPLEGADLAKAARIPVYTVALGTPNGTLNFNGGGGGGGGGGFPGGPGAFPGGRRVPVPPDPDTLRAIASRTGGQFFAAQSAKSLQSAYSNLGSRLGRKPGQSEITYGFLAAAALLLVAGGVLSALWSPRLP